MFETGLKDHLKRLGGTPNNVLGLILGNNLTGASIGDISTEVINNIRPVFACNSVTDYNSVMPNLLSDLAAETDPLKSASKLLHLITITRNQVAHNIDNTNRLYGNIGECKKIIRLIFLGLMFSEYI